MTNLRISADLALPMDWMSLATVVYGARGSGKTTFGSVVAEEVTKAGQRFCAVDLKGDWYGLKSTADGTGEGIPVVVFGGDHADLPLEPEAGLFVGETIASLNQSSILDFEHMSKGKQVRFLAAFFERLYDRNRDPLLLLMDEGQRYAPQGRTFSRDQAMCLGAVEDIVKLGRKHGIGVVVFTQRGAGLNKEVSELCDMLVAFRTPGPLDQKRVKEWLDANATAEQGRLVMERIASLPTGTAIFASAHPDLTFFKVATVRRRETFDSSATPKVGHSRTEPAKLAAPDLDALRDQMAAAIARAKADDPKELRRQIAELKKQLSARPTVTDVPAPQVIEREVEIRVEVPVLTDTDRQLFHDTQLALTGASHDMERLEARLTQLVTIGDFPTGPPTGMGAAGTGSRRAQPLTSSPARRATQQPGVTAPRRGGPPERREGAGDAPASSSPSDFRPSGAQQRVLDALAWLEAKHPGASERMVNMDDGWATGATGGGGG